MRRLALIRDWFFRDWMYAGAVAALFLLAFAPALGSFAALPVLLVYVQLPAYMLHQVEEHARDRFRRFVNERIGGGREVLSTPAVVVINVPGVWAVYVATIYLLFDDLGYGLIGTYLMLVNAVLHVVGALLQRAYHPGLWSAVAIFLPLGGLSLWALWGVGPPYHAVGLGIAVAVHLAIVAHVKRRAATVRA